MTALIARRRKSIRKQDQQLKARRRCYLGDSGRTLMPQLKVATLSPSIQKKLYAHLIDAPRGTTDNPDSVDYRKHTDRRHPYLFTAAGSSAVTPVQPQGLRSRCGFEPSVYDLLSLLTTFDVPHAYMMDLFRSRTS